MQQIYVRRSQIYADSFRHFSKESFDVSMMLKVMFIGESAVDDGGPQREYFQLLQHDIACKSGLFGGWPNHVPLHNVSALAHNKFYTIGKMLVTTIVQGGQPPLYFAGAVADFLVYKRYKCVCVCWGGGLATSTILLSSSPSIWDFNCSSIISCGPACK